MDEKSEMKARMTSNPMNVPGTGLLRALKCHTDDCEEIAQYVEGSATPSSKCACEIVDLPDGPGRTGFHFARRCPAGHLNTSHSSGLVFVDPKGDRPPVRAFIPGLFAPIEMPCEECDEIASYVPELRREVCTCEIEQIGTHIVRRCPNGHEGAAHIVANPLSGEEFEETADETIIRTKLPKRDFEKLKALADAEGKSTDDLVTDLVVKESLKDSICDCTHPFPSHAHAGGRCSLCPCEIFRYCGNDMRSKGAVLVDELSLLARLVGERLSIRIAERKSLADMALSKEISALVRQPRPIRADMKPEEIRRVLGKRSQDEILLAGPLFKKIARILLEDLENEGVDLLDYDAILKSKTLGSGSKVMLSFTQEENGFQNRILTFLRLVAAGEREFHVSPSIGASLLLTEVKGVECLDIHLPYKSVIFRVPPGLVYLNDGVSLLSVIVTEYRMSSGMLERGVEGGQPRRVVLFYAMGDKPEYQQIWFTTLDGGLLDVDAVVELNAAYEKKNGTSVSRLIMRLIFNTILYISLPSADVVLEGQEELTKLREKVGRHPPGSYKRTRALNELKGAEKKPEIRKVGWKIKVPSWVREAAAHEGTAKGRAFTASWSVRGHWRNQAIGKGHAERKLIRIEPYLCRRDLGERLTQPPYVVE